MTQTSFTITPDQLQVFQDVDGTDVVKSLGSSPWNTTALSSPYTYGTRPVGVSYPLDSNKVIRSASCPITLSVVSGSIPHFGARLASMETLYGYYSFPITTTPTTTTVTRAPQDGATYPLAPYKPWAGNGNYDTWYGPGLGLEFYKATGSVQVNIASIGPLTLVLDDKPSLVEMDSSLSITRGTTATYRIKAAYQDGSPVIGQVVEITLNSVTVPGVGTDYLVYLADNYPLTSISAVTDENGIASFTLYPGNPASAISDASFVLVESVALDRSGSTSGDGTSQSVADWNDWSDMYDVFTPATIMVATDIAIPIEDYGTGNLLQDSSLWTYPTILGWNGTEYKAVGSGSVEDSVEMHTTDAYKAGATVVAHVKLVNNDDHGNSYVFVVYTSYGDSFPSVLYSYDVAAGSSLEDDINIATTADGVVYVAVAYDAESLTPIQYFNGTLEISLGSTPPTPPTPIKSGVFQLDSGWGLDGVAMKHSVTFNNQNIVNGFDNGQLQKLRVHGLNDGFTQLKVSVNTMESDGLMYDESWSEPETLDLPAERRSFQDKKSSMTNYTDLQNRGVALQLKIETNVEDYTKPEPSHVLQALATQSTDTESREN